MPYYCCINGRILSAHKATVPVNDIGLLRGYAVFDYLRTYDRRPFLLEKHLQRFSNSARELGMRLPVSVRRVGEIISLLIKKSQTKKDVGIRLVLTGGDTRDGITPSRPTFIIIIEKLLEPARKDFEQGVTLMLNEFQREIPQVKTTNYKNAIRLQHEKRRRGAYEILYHSDGKIRETTRNNFFLFKGNTLITPREKILHGITRGLVIELAKNRFEVEERDLRVSELKEADEAFITGTTKKVLPVVKVDDLMIGNGKPGELTNILLRSFNDYIAGRT